MQHCDAFFFLTGGDWDDCSALPKIPWRVSDKLEQKATATDKSSDEVDDIVDGERVPLE